MSACLIELLPEASLIELVLGPDQTNFSASVASRRGTGTRIMFFLPLSLCVCLRERELKRVCFLKHCAIRWRIK